jgi:hypothetical protein
MYGLVSQVTSHKSQVTSSFLLVDARTGKIVSVSHVKKGPYPQGAASVELAYDKHLLLYYIKDLAMHHWRYAEYKVYATCKHEYLESVEFIKILKDHKECSEYETLIAKFADAYCMYNDAVMDLYDNRKNMKPINKPIKKSKDVYESNKESFIKEFHEVEKCKDELGKCSDELDAHEQRMRNVMDMLLEEMRGHVVCTLDLDVLARHEIPT